jgi:hypothetical protein
MLMGRQYKKYTDVEIQRAADNNTEMARRLREQRCLMGLLQKDVYVPLHMNAGQYSRIEDGELSADKALKFIERMFEQWKEKEINRLQCRINYIRSL